MTSPAIRVMLVDDSPLALAVLERILVASPDIKVVGTCRNGQEALDRIDSLNPDVVCTDFQMPIVNGLELTREIMARSPRPVLVVSAMVGNRSSSTVFSLMEAGALDVLLKPELDPNMKASGSSELASKIRILAGVKVFRRHGAGKDRALLSEKPPLAPRTPETVAAPKPTAGYKIVAIGASTGGPQAFQRILSALPSNFPLPIVCVQHIAQGFLGGLVEWLKMSSSLPVEIARPGFTANPGTVYFAGEEGHLQIGPKGFVRSWEAPEAGHRPSVTVMMNSVAKNYGTHAIGVLLTGMGSDGAAGLQAIRSAGGLTVAQDEESCVVYGMPKAAVALGPVHHILPLDRVAPALLRIVSPQRKEDS